MFEEKRELRIPGPTPVAPRVMRATTKAMINHRGKEFKELLNRVTVRLKDLFGTQGELYILTGSGTASMEAAVVNTVSPGDKVLVLIGGVFGERWAGLNRAFGAEVRTLEYDWTTGADPEAVRRCLAEEPGISTVFATHNESSTGVLNDLAGISRARAQANSKALLVVDSVSGLGGAPLLMDEWGIDVVVTGSQKCLMMPPGLAFIAIGPAAADRIAGGGAPRFYFDLRKFKSSFEKGETPWTPNVSLVQALEEALAMIEEEGVENMYRRHLLMRDMVRSGLGALGLPPMVKENYASPTVSAVSAPETLDVEKFRRILATEYGMIISGGQGRLAGKIFRIGHMGYSLPLDMLTTLAAVELGLLKTGHPVSLGTGVRAAQEVWAGWS
ncbi:MAG: alanine--glyoxylate aminotransferase family protein [Firmicutes bacterium]|nr:alanine--glyoxylate aminotransferase family protein [Bacillota bacterium]